MISDGLKKIIETFRKQGTMSFLEPATEEQISAFEKENGITFPEEYREWLSFSDGGELFLPAGVQFYGVAHKPLIDVNDDRRPDDSYVAVGGLCDGALSSLRKAAGSLPSTILRTAKFMTGSPMRTFTTSWIISMTCSEWTARMVAMTGMMTRTGTGTKTVKMMTTIRMKGNLSHL